MEHIFKQGENESVFVLLHGTGGTEHDLIPVAEMLDNKAGVLAVRGEVKENGMNRFFKRHGEGQYDVQDLEKRGEELFQFIREKSTEHQFNMEEVIFVGFSNGSNIAINMLLKEESPINKAILFAPLYPVDISTNNKNLSGSKVFLSLGEGDPMVPESESKRVVKLFEDKGADVHTKWVSGHRLTENAVLEAQEWLKQ